MSQSTISDELTRGQSLSEFDVTRARITNRIISKASIDAPNAISEKISFADIADENHKFEKRMANELNWMQYRSRVQWTSGCSQFRFIAILLPRLRELMGVIKNTHRKERT